MKRLFVLLSVYILFSSVLCMQSFAKSLSFCDMDDVVYPCIDEVKRYLQAGAGADITKFDYKVEFQGQPVTISWQADGLSISGYVLELSTKSDFSDAEKVNLDKSATSYSLKFLLRDTKYYVRITTIGEDVFKAQTEFVTAYDCPRFLDVGGFYNNCRDLGGYRVGEKQILQNMIIRGSNPDGTLTTEGYKFLTEYVKVKTQLDLRAMSENGARKSSSFESAESYVNVPLTAYLPCFTPEEAPLYREAFRVFANKDAYPVYMHCSGGADRTGTVAIILLAYLGVDRDEIIQDYVLTSFSPVCHNQSPRRRGSALEVLDGIGKYDGETLSEKAESYLVSIGLTQEELFNINAILFGDSVELSQEDYVSTETGICFAEWGKPFVITIDDGHKAIDRIMIENSAVSYHKIGCEITIPASSMKRFLAIENKGEILFRDGTKTAFTFSVRK